MNSNSNSDISTDSESDGGMQLDETPIEDISDEGSLPMSDMEDDSPRDNVHGWTPPHRAGIEADPTVRNMQTRTFYDRFDHRAEDPLIVYDQGHEKETRMRSHLTDEKHAALCVLTDREMLMTYALAANETIPQTRRRFMAKYLAPNDRERAEKLYDPQFFIPGDGEGGEPSLVKGRYREVIGGSEDHGWHKPGHLRRFESAVKLGSGATSRSVSGANSPRRVSGVRLTGSGRSSMGRDGSVGL